ncbi:hypothetical protein ASG93_02335 [Paenibacillus sp. Soil787]|nr:hypothetical protein ASG93_02335 [Paenibacillus sp. Soil787]
MCISLWTIATLLIRSGKSGFSLAMGIAFIIGGSSSFAVSMNLIVIPFLEKHHVLQLLVKQTLIAVTIVGAYLYWYFFHWATLVASIYFCNWTFKWRKTIIVLLAIPPILLLISHLATRPPHIIDIESIRYKAGMYMLAACLLFVIGCWKERNALIRKSRVRTASVTIMALVWSYSMDFIGASRLSFESTGLIIESNDLWQFNYLLILLMLVSFIVFGVKYGIWGIKIRFEREKYDYSMRALTLGTSILNHSIKNELSKINYLNERTKAYLEKGLHETAVEQLEIVDQVTSHVLNMIHRIKEKANDIVLVERPYPLRTMIDYTVQSLTPVVEAKNMTIVWSCEADGQLVCDIEHMKEVLNNLCLNAVDAMQPDKGILEISTNVIMKKLTIAIKDNGTGISADNIENIFNPFFTTKRNPDRFGLGLSYCYNVMHKHGGSIHLSETEYNKGTTFLLCFPGKMFKARQILS